MKLERESINTLTKALSTLEEGFNLPDLKQEYHEPDMERILQQVAERMQDNYPYFHPLFAGQMLKPPHPVAKAAYMLSLWINPNNHAMDGSKASSPMEKEVVSDLAKMFQWKQHLGHLTSGGTMANLEALWVAAKLHPDKYILASDQAHYTHERISDVLKLKFKKVATKADGTMDLDDLKQKLAEGNVGTIVCTMGTTGLGSVDPLDDILQLREKYEFRIHADAAYGGYFRLLSNLQDKTMAKYQSITHVDSIVIDPHKHGLQPYGCGCILFRDPEVARFYLHDSPYTYFTSEELHLGEISLECSRAGASAVALWATHQLLPPVEEGDFAKDLAKCRNAAIQLHHRLAQSEHFMTILEPETDIVVWAVKASSVKGMNQKAQDLFRKAEKNQLFLSLFKYPTSKLEQTGIRVDDDYLICLRSCLMKPEHDNWLDEIWDRLISSVS